MGQKKNERRIDENAAMAKGRMLRTSPQKLNLVAQAIRGMPVEKAMAELTFSRKRIAQSVNTAAYALERDSLFEKPEDPLRAYEVAEIEAPPIAHLLPAKLNQVRPVPVAQA